MVGDVIANDEGKWYKIKSVYSVDGGYYIATDKDGEDNRICFGLANTYYHHWTIKEAKCGEVLSYKDGEIEWIFVYKDIIPSLQQCPFDTVRYYAILFDNRLSRDGYYSMVRGIHEYNFTPATKDQRGLLLSKLKEDGAEEIIEKIYKDLLR